MAASNVEDKRCPLCTEEMDWTDQQFKPCKCGYQVCVWCWHHMIDIAEKDEIEGRCPACRTVYEKERTVAMQANCERAMTRSSNRKNRPPKAKPITNEVKTDLTNVRVIQRKMAYVIGLPLSLADEDLLQRKEYFGQYGKVSKVSLSRTVGGAIQQFINETCSVYITYSKEEEALRCIQSVHGFYLEDRLLRASFGTAKYCHTWLKNMPCNNPACLYLHNIGAEEDSFGKDEVAAVHTRSIVQQKVGATNSLTRRSGNVLPHPVEDISNSSSAFADISAVRSAIADTAHGSVNSNGDFTCSLPSNYLGGEVTAFNKAVSLVDVVGRSSCSGPEKDENFCDRRISNLCSELSSATINGDAIAGDPYSVSTLLKNSSSNHLLPWEKQFRDTLDKPFREDLLLFKDQKFEDLCDSSQRASFLPPPYPAKFSEDSGGRTLRHKKTCILGDPNANHNAVYNHEDGASLPIGCVNSVLYDGCQEMKFQNSAKSDRIYRSSNSFSSEEIVEHLRRIDDDNLTNDKDKSVLDAVESSIISNIMSLDFDSYDNALALPSGLSKLLDDPDDRYGSSWNSLNNEQSEFSFVKHDCFSREVAGSNRCFAFPDLVDNKEHRMGIPQCQVTRPQSSAPPRFSVPFREPPPWLSASVRTGCLTRALSGSQLINNISSLSSSLLQTPTSGYNSSAGEVDFMGPGQGKPANGLKNSGLDTQPASTSKLNASEDEARLWLLIQQSASSHQDSNISHMFASRAPFADQVRSYAGHMGNGLFALEDIYDLSSRLVDPHQRYDTSSFTQFSQQKYANGHVPNTDANWNSIDKFHSRNEVGIQRNEILGVNKYFPGYGDSVYQMPSSGDVYTRVFGM